ncbi:MAG TPA: hypothetical protein VLZ06_07855 [Solirubrobacteraceae bacterium]|nr:hypothetical protein [Solirubrobacteraceae bacterium]
MAGVPDFSAPGPWSLPVGGYVVEELDLSYPAVLVARDPRSRSQLKVQLNLPFTLSDEGAGQQEIGPEVDGWDEQAGHGVVYLGPRELMPLLSPLRTLTGDVIDYATVWPTSELQIETWRGRIVTVSANDGGEWEVFGPGFYIVGVFGQPTIWTGELWRQ